MIKWKVIAECDVQHSLSAGEWLPLSTVIALSCKCVSAAFGTISHD